jgi:glycosyltransferase involved in cell wall biosynthesis
LQAQRIAIKPNFIHPDPGPGNGQGGYAVFIGRLSPEKGIKTLLSAWTQLAGRLPLKIVGDGPLAENVKAAANQTASIEWLGRRQPPEVLSLLGEAACLVMPSIWYETFGRTIIEAYAKGTPVVASRLGAMAELVHDGHSGLLFEPGDPADLALKIHALLDDPARTIGMRRAARREYEDKYTAETNYEMMMAIYAEAAAAHRREATRSKAESSPYKI